MHTRGRIFVLSDNRDSAGALSQTLTAHGYRAVEVRSMRALVNGLDEARDLALLELPDTVAGIREFRAYHPQGYVCAVAPDDACLEAAVSAGAYDCIGRPVEPARLLVITRNAMSAIALSSEAHPREASPDELISTNQRLRGIHRRLKSLYGAEGGVLILGEPGTEDRLVARALHEGGFRRRCRLVEVEASAPGLMDRLIGGDARTDVPAPLIRAEGGTLVLRGLVRPDTEDEFDRLARLAMDRDFSPHAGPNGGGPMRSGARLVATMHTDEPEGWALELFPSLIRIPPLRNTRAEILPLAEGFLQETRALVDGPCRRFTRDAEKALLAYAWPGNTAELKSVTARAYLICANGEIEPRHLGLGGGGGESGHCSAREYLQDRLGRYIKGLTEHRRFDLHQTVVSEFERALIELVLEETGGNQLRTAGALGISRATLRAKVKKFEISTQGGTRRSGT